MEKKESINLFLDELILWNKKINLVAKNEINRLHDRHVIDSEKILDYIPAGSSVLDIGSGNGFPAIPAAICRKDITLYAMEPNKKKYYFLCNIKNKLNLINLHVLNSKMGEKIKKKFDVITSRALASVQKIIEKSHEYLKETGRYVLYNDFSDNELSAAQDLTGGIIHNVDKVVYKLGDGVKRTLTVIKVKK